jgi:pimeloyl-ACP methyl ester carboxylesterase
MEQKLYWDYYSFVKSHPVSYWTIPTHILYGSQDELCENDVISQFAKQFSCWLEIVKGSSHYFHTEKQLEVFNKFIAENI